MADSRTAGIALLIAGLAGLLLSRQAAAQTPPGGGDPGNGGPPPADRFEPVVFGDPLFVIDLVD